MPEGLEAELYRRGAERTLGRRISSVAVDDRQAMAAEIGAVLPGRTFTAARRHGKLVVLDLDGSPDGDHDLDGDQDHDQRPIGSSFGLHFGMTGRLVVDGAAPIDELEYSSGRDDAAWDRLTVTFDDGGVLRVNDPRRWATFVMDPSLERLGPDFLDVTAGHLFDAFARRGTPVKAALLDQRVVAGYGNMSVDEVLWHTGIAPVTPAREVPLADVERIVAIAPGHLRRMLDDGGSHRGTITPEIRAVVPPCPRDGAPMRRDEVGGRTTIWCPTHQRPMS